MNLSEAIKEKEECQGYGIMCERCSLRISEYFLRDYITGVKFGIKTSVCDALSLAEYLLSRNEGEIPQQ